LSFPRLLAWQAEHHEPEIIATQEYVNDAADKLAATPRTSSLFLRPNTFSAGSHVMQQFPLEITTGGFTLAAGHRLTAVGRHLEFRRGLLHRGDLVRRLYGASQPACLRQAALCYLDGPSVCRGDGQP
jgi:hypothetical protein